MVHSAMKTFKKKRNAIRATRGGALCYRESTFDIYICKKRIWHNRISTVGKNRGAVIVKCVHTVEEFTEQFGPTKITVNK